MCLQTTKQTVQINFSELTRNPQHQPVSIKTIQFEPNFHDTTISVTCIIHQHDQLVEYKAVEQLHCQTIISQCTYPFYPTTKRKNNNKDRNSSQIQQQSSVDHEYDYIQFIQQTPTIQ